MARQQHPPLPSAVRPIFWVLRAFAVVVGAGALYAAVLAATQGKWSTAFIVLIMGGGFVALAWMHPLNRWYGPLLAGLALFAAIVARSWATAVILTLPVALIVWSNRRRGNSRLGRVNPNRIAVAEPFAVMKNARGLVAEFQALGFERVGALRFSIGPVKVIESLLLAPDGRSYAAVTDAILNVTSLFADGRGLVTRNSDRALLPAYLLVDSVPGGTPADLIESHGRALALLAEEDHYPVPIEPPELAEIALAGERAALEWINARRPVVDRRGPLWSRPDRKDQIEEWHGGSWAEPESQS